eukprot:686497_1
MAEFEECMQQFDDMKARIKNIHADCDENNYLRDMPNKQNVSTPKLYLKEMRHLRGYFGEVYAMQRAGDSRSLVSTSQDGKLIVWDGFTTNKTVVVPLRSSWVMTCAFAPSQEFVACGGLDNICSVYKLDASPIVSASDPKLPYKELSQHEGYLSCCRFVDDTEIVTCSGDSTCIQWDVETGTPKLIFGDHM